MKIKKLNKKWFMLLEATIWMAVWIMILIIVTLITLDFSKMNKQTSENLTMMQTDSYKTELNFLKNRLISIWKLSTQYENNPYYGWNKLKITNSKSLNELDWYYVLEKWWSCDSWLWYCLSEKTINDWSDSKLSGAQFQYEEKIDWTISKKWTEEEIYEECSEANDECIKYRFHITNLNNTSFIPVTYTDINWNTITLNDKKLVTLELTNWQSEEIKKLEFILSLY